MPDKILLSQSSTGFVGLGLNYRLGQHFSLECVQPGRTYDPTHHIMCFHHLSVDDILLQSYKDQGFKIIINYLDDSYICEPVTVVDNVLALRSKHWWWIAEHFLYTDRNYQSMTTPSHPDKFFLLLMNLIRGHRDSLLGRCSDFLPNSLWSYVQKGHGIQDDVPLSTNKVGISDDRYYNPEWYASTMFSLVAETTLGVARPVELCPPLGQRLFVTEKTFKPMAFKHAFVVYGTPYTLKHLRELGFETFAHAVDESYDTILDDNMRLDAIVTELKRLHEEFQSGQILFQDSVSQQKIQHNFEKFYDKQIIEQLWLTDIVEPIRKFIES